MATRALIGYLDDNKVLTSTYNHYDGYPDHLGKMLDKYYDNDEKAKFVANEGYISYIDEDGNIEAKNKMNPEKTRLDKEWEDALYDMAGQIDNYGADFAYIWYEEDGDWAEIKNTGTRSMLDQLANQLASAATMFGPVDENIDYKLDPYDDKEEVEGMIIKLIVGKKGVDEDVAKSFIDTHYEDIIKMSDTDDILDEFDEFMSVNTEYVKEESGKELNPGNPPANFISPNEEGDEAVGRESASGAFEESKNWRGETLKEQFKRLLK
tara:strand:+ start:1908 stop:2705 length:798 start_codon:yes stop_codon:yes gene_type:complete